MKIILAHGVLGFGVLGPLQYFNGVAAHIEATFRGVTVATSRVNPIGSVAERAQGLAELVVREAGNERVHIFAHSMGGLDARRALSNDLAGVRSRVKTLVMIGTPHRGSPVADAIESGKPAALEKIPLPIRAELHINQRALHDLTTAVAAKADGEMTDAPGVTYVHVAGDMTRAGAHASIFFRSIEAIFGVGEANDGVVTMTSARTRCGKLQDAAIWPTDHAGEIGWNLDRPIPAGLPFAEQAHLDRHPQLVQARVE